MSRNRKSWGFEPSGPDSAQISLLLALIITAIFASLLFLDVPVARFLTDIDPNLRLWFGRFTDLGQAGWILIPAGLLALAFLWRGAGAGSAQELAACRDITRLCSLVFVAVAATGLLAALLKLVIGRVRPKLSAQFGSFDFSPLAFNPDFAGFPSGHATTCLAFATVLAIVISGWRALILTLGCWAAVTRLIVNAHYVSDVIAGAALGTAGAWWITRYWAAQGWLAPPGSFAARRRLTALRLWGRDLRAWLRGQILFLRRKFDG